MDTNNQKTNEVQNSKTQGRFVEPTVFLKGDYITLALPGNVLVRKHINYFKRILGVPFIPKTETSSSQVIPTSSGLA